MNSLLYLLCYVLLCLEVILNNKHYAQLLFAPFCKHKRHDLQMFNKEARPYAYGMGVYLYGPTVPVRSGSFVGPYRYIYHTFRTVRVRSEILICSRTYISLYDFMI